MASGDAITRFSYHEEDGSVRKVELSSSSNSDSEEEDFSMTLTQLQSQDGRQNQRQPQQRSLTTEEVISFGARTGLASARFVYGDPLAPGGQQLVSGRVGGQEVPPQRGSLRHIWGPDLAARGRGGGGTGGNGGGFTVQTHSLNGTTLSDSEATFFRSDSSESLMMSGGARAYVTEFTREECRGNLEKVVRAWENVQQVTRYKYDPDGQLERASTSTSGGDDWRFKYNDHGLLASSSRTSAGRKTKKSVFHYDEHGRLSRVNGGPDLAYDARGRVVRGHRGEAFAYDHTDLLSSAVLGDGSRLTYRYDHMGRLVAKYVELDFASSSSSSSSVMNVTQYFYALPGRPHLVSHAFRPAQGSLVSLSYDDRGRLLSLSDTDDSEHDVLYAACDPGSGSPILLVAPDGSVARKFVRSPFGEEEGGGEEEDPVSGFSSSSLLGGKVVGFAGGIPDEDAGLVHMQVQ